MRLKIFPAVLAALTMILAACSSDNEGFGSSIEEGKSTYLQLELTQSAGNSTRASFDNGLNGIPTETAINDVRLYIFNSVGILEIVENFSASDNGTKVFEATTGTKHFVALVNMNGFHPAATVNSTSLTNFKKEVLTLANKMDDIAKDNFFWMSNTRDVSALLEEATQAEATSGPKNQVSVEVSRLVAKIGVEFAPTTELEGKLDPATVVYKINNNPVKTNLFATRDAAGFLATPFYQDPYLATNYFRHENTSYKTTTVTGGQYDAGSVTYMIENSNETALMGTSTYALIRGTFTPDTVYDEDGLNPTAGVPAADFWRVYDDGLGGGTLGEGNYGTKYYHEEPTAAEIAAEGGNGFAKYTAGVCYYALHLNDTENNLPAIDKYVVQRNTAWAVTIVSVNGAGANDEDNVIVDPGKKLDAETFMKAVIHITPWVQRGMSGGI